MGKPQDGQTLEEHTLERYTLQKDKAQDGQTRGWRNPRRSNYIITFWDKPQNRQNLQRANIKKGQDFRKGQTGEYNFGADS